MKKETGPGEEGSSISVSHKACLAQLTVLAGKHKQIAVSLGQLAKEYECHVTRLTEQHKTVEVEGKRLQHDLDNSIKKLFKSHEKFERRQLDSNLAEDSLSKSEPDSRISRAELERVREETNRRRRPWRRTTHPTTGLPTRCPGGGGGVGGGGGGGAHILKQAWRRRRGRWRK